MPDTEQPAEHWGPKAENDHVLLKVCDTKKVTYATQIWGEKVQVVVRRSWPCIKVCVRCSRCSSLCKLRIRTRSDRAAACRTGNALCTHSTHKIVTSAPPAANPTSAICSGDQSRWPTILGCALVYQLWSTTSSPSSELVSQNSAWQTATMTTGQDTCIKVCILMV